MIPLLFLYSHPIQYFAPLSRRLSESGTFDLKVLYCSRQGAEAVVDREFGQPVQWDTPLLEGYRSVFLPNWRGKHQPVGGFWSLINPRVVHWLWRSPRSVVVVHGWGHFTHVLAIVFGKMRGHCICIRGESCWSHEQQLPRWKRRLKKLLLGQGLFRFADFFLYIGEENRRFYRQMGVAERQLVFTPYSVDNAYFSAQWAALKGHAIALRRQLGLPKVASVVLFCGKLIAKKRPLDLLEAFHQAGVSNSVLVYVGDGALREPLKDRARALGIEHAVHITGFVNQSTIGQYYAAADVFVMCSDAGETWGLATNEAMNFGLPILLSDRTGCAADLCQPGANGFVFPTGDVASLSERLRHLLTLLPEERQAMGRVSQSIVSRYSFENIAQNLQQALAKHGYSPESIP